MRVDGGQIDEQHKHLLDIANKILSMNSQNLDIEKLKTAISELFKYVQEHFNDEEALMLKIGYPEYEEHQRLHAEIIDDMYHHLTTPERIESILANFRRLVTRWIIDHILNEDRKIHTFMVQQL